VWVCGEEGAKGARANAGVGGRYNYGFHPCAACLERNALRGAGLGCLVKEMGWGGGDKRHWRLGQAGCLLMGRGAWLPNG